MSLGHSGSFTASKSRECWCETFGARCTNGELEYGHPVGCPNRSESFSKGTSSGPRRYKSDDFDGGGSA